MERKLFEWVKAAIEHDNWEKLSQDAPHSSSILDIFTSFQQLVDFVKALDWPDERDVRRFYFAVFYDIVASIARYGFLMVENLILDLQTTRFLQPPPPPKKAKFGKMKVPIPKMIRKKVHATQLNGTRLTSKACVRVLNVEAVISRFATLTRNIPVVNEAGKKHSSDGSLFENKTTCIIQINVLNAALKTIHPWPTKLRARISNKSGKIIGRTSVIRQASQVAWNESIFAYYDRSSPVLTIGIVHYLDQQRESLFSYGTFTTDGLTSEIPLTKTVSLGEYGYICVEISILPELPETLHQIVRWMSEVNKDIMIEYIVEHLSFDFRDRIHPISLKYKTNVVAKIFKDQQILTLTEDDVQDIEEYLAPLFDFMNSNLEVLMTNMDDEIALKVVLGVWNRFVIDAESLIVPSLMDDKERKQWDERRFQFFTKYIEIAADFFRGGGDGLSMDSIHSKPYIQLLKIMKNYFKSREELIDIYIRMDKGNDPEESDWILKLIKMKNGKDFVEEELQKILHK